MTDPSTSASRRYESDLQACYSIAKKAEAEYQARQEKEMGQKMMAGILIGAIAGAAIGDNSNWAAAGAAQGAAAGMAATDTELAVGGPRRIIDRCMTQRGHIVLSDLGRG